MGRVIEFFVRNPVAGKLLLLLMLAGGLLSIPQLRVQTFPDIDPRQLSVTIPYAGASPSEIEKRVTRRVEESIKSLDGIQRMTSLATPNLGRVLIDLELLADSKAVLEDVQSAVDQIEDFPPPTADSVEIRRERVNLNVLTVAVSSERLDEYALRVAADHVIEALYTLPAVARVSLLGTADREIRVEIDELALRQHGLSIDRVGDAIEHNSTTVPAGIVSTEGGDITLRIHGEKNHGNEFEPMPVVARPDGTLLRVEDLGTVSDSFEDRDLRVEIDGVPAVLLKVDKSSGEDQLEVAEQVFAMLDSYVAPSGAHIFVWDDATSDTRSRLKVLLSAGAISISLVFLLMALVFDLRVAIWVAVGIPAAFLGAGVVFLALDMTLDVILIYGMVVAIGIVVDDAMMVGDSIVVARESGLTGADAAIAGARAVAGPVNIAVLTTMIGFVPLLFSEGTFAAILTTLAVAVIVVLAFSLVEAFCVLPAHLSPSATLNRRPLSDIQSAVSGWLARIRDETIVPAVGRSVRRPWLVIGASVLVIAIPFVLAAAGFLRVSFVQGIPSSFVQADVTLPVGTPFENTNQAANRLVDAARKVNEQSSEPPFTTVAVLVGEHRAGNFTGAGNIATGAPSKGTHFASVIAHVRREAERELGVEELKSRWQQTIGSVPGAETVFFAADSTGSGVTKTGFALLHEDEELLSNAVHDLMESYRQNPHLANVDTTFKLGERQFDIQPTSKGLAMGLTPAILASQLRSRLHGVEVRRIQRGRDEITVSVRYPEEDRRSIAEFLSQQVKAPGGVDVPLTTVANIVESRENATLMRIDGQRAAEVTAQVIGKELTALEADQLVLAEVMPSLQEKYDGLKYRRIGPAVGLARTLENLLYVLPIALLVMYVLITLQMRSYVQPLVILSGIPFALAGSILGHMHLGYEFTLISVFGIFATAGVVLNDSVVLMDRYNRFRRERGMDAVRAVQAAAQARFRPIVLTTLTTMLGLAPILYIKSEATAQVVVLAVSMVYGLLLSSFGLIFCVPSLILLVDRVRDRFSRLFGTNQTVQPGLANNL